MEELIKKETEEYLKRLKKAFNDKGLEFTDISELTFRMGVSAGIQIAGLALVSKGPSCLDSNE